MRIIKARPGDRRKFLKQQILAAASGDVLDPHGELDKVINSRTADGKFLRRLLSPPRPPKLSRRLRSR